MNWFKRFFHRPKIPSALWTECLQNLPFLQHLDAGEKARLKSLSESLLAEKTITGAGGLVMTDEISVNIAIQACLPVLNLNLSLYEDMPGIVVYPDAFVVPYREMDEAGVVHEGHETLAGEAITAGGMVVLSWADVKSPEHPGQNVVIHEFAHVIDLCEGDANGRPPFLHRFHDDIYPDEWKSVFAVAYKDFCRRVKGTLQRLPKDFDPESEEHAALEKRLFAELPLDSYASEDPAEFFAIASEAFFVRPQPLARTYPGVYQLLSQYYRQDTLTQDSNQAFL